MMFLFLPNTGEQRVLNFMRYPKLAHILVYLVFGPWNAECVLALRNSPITAITKLAQLKLKPKL